MRQGLNSAWKKLRFPLAECYRSDIFLGDLPETLEDNLKNTTGFRRKYLVRYVNILNISRESHY
jgi:hypothetical protein